MFNQQRRRLRLRKQANDSQPGSSISMLTFLEFDRRPAKPPRGLHFLRRKLMKSQIRRLAMRAPPMRPPTAAPAIAPVSDRGPGVGVEVAPGAGLENLEDVGEVSCEGVEICEVRSDVVEVPVWRGSWIAGIVVREPTSKVVVPVVEIMVFVGAKGTTVADRVIVESRGSSLSTVAVTK
jgi:hypothetical protein